MQLHEVPHIRLNAEIGMKAVTVRELSNFFRTFKQPDETLSHDCIYSPFLQSEDSDGFFSLNDDYITRTQMLDYVKDKFTGYYISLYLAYDFANAPVYLKYSTDEEFRYIGRMIDEIVTGTNLSLLFLVSHFTQFADKQGTFLKPEHYHCIIGNSEYKGFPDKSMSDEIKGFADRLFKNKLIKIRPMKT